MPHLNQECCYDTYQIIRNALRSSLLDFPENPSRVLVFESTSSLNDLVSLICEQTNLYAAQNGRNFVATTEEVKAFLDVYLLISICKLPNIKLLACLRIFW